MCKLQQLVPQIQTLKQLSSPVKTKRKSTHTERHEKRKRQKLTAEERRLQREATMILEKQDQERKLADFMASTKEITEAAKAGKLKEIIEKSKKPNSSSVAEQEREGKDEATLRLFERIRRETEEEQKLQTYVKQEPLTEEEEVVTTSCGVPGFNLNIDKVIDIKAISGTKRLPERLSFEMKDGKRQIWPVQTVLTLDYRTLICVYNIISKEQVMGRQVAAYVQQKICSMRREKAATDDLPTKMIVPNPTNKKIHFEPFHMMEFRDAQGQMRFFRMEDNLKTAINQDLRTLQTYLDDRVEDEYRFKSALQRQLEQEYGKEA